MNRKKKSGKTQKTREGPRQFRLYTDGGCLINPGGRGGYGAVLIDLDSGIKKEMCGSVRATTNNRMELTAVVRGLEAVPAGAQVTVYSDSQYLIKTMHGEYRQIKNTDLWDRLREASVGLHVDYEWVKGHNGNKWNEHCDRLAQEAMKSELCEADIAYERSEEYNPVKVLFNDKTIHQGIAEEIIIPEALNGAEPHPKTRKAFREEHMITDDCAKAILTFYDAGRRSFNAYLSLKTFGYDWWSGRTLPELTEDAGTDKVQWVKKFLKDNKAAASCLRWHMRGMTLEDSIRKVMIDIEMDEQVKKKQPKNNT